MRRPPPLSELPHYPVTGGLGLLAVACTLAWWAHHSIDGVDMNYLAFHGEPWRLLTSTFPHVDVFHLFFNVYWLWVMGTVIEQRFGHVRLALLSALLAAGSAAAEYAFASAGVGLSGVVYGYFGFLWVMGRRDPALADVLDKQTAWLFVGWFFLCILMTESDRWHVGNYAHGAGAILGALIAWTCLPPLPRKILAGVSVLVACTGITWAATAGRPMVNFSKDGGRDLDVLGREALQHDDLPKAIRLYQIATSMRKVEPGWWYNLGYGYFYTKDSGNALAAYGHYLALDPGDSIGHGVILALFGDDALTHKDYPRARKFYEDAVRAADASPQPGQPGSEEHGQITDATKGDWWRILAELRTRTGDLVAAQAAIARAKQVENQRGLPGSGTDPADRAHSESDKP